MSNDFYSELDKIKNKALAVNQALELQKEASLNTSKELAQKELEATAESAARAADAKVDSLQKVRNASMSASSDFVSDWKNAFANVQGDASNFADALGSLFGSSGSSSETVSKLSNGDLLGFAVDVAQDFFGGFFADGGRPPKNKVSLVGERGPELFVPDTEGTIVPNESLKEQQATPIVVNQQFTFQSLDPVTNMRMLQAQKAQIQNWVVDGIKSNENGLRNAVESV